LHIIIIMREIGAGENSHLTGLEQEEGTSIIEMTEPVKMVEVTPENMQSVLALLRGRRLIPAVYSEQRGGLARLC
jgi:hypothetical protein